MADKKLYRFQKDMEGRLADVKSQLLKLPNVVAVGIGFKESKGKFTKEMAYRVFVSKKTDKAFLKEEELVPSSIGNIQTDVLTPLRIVDDSDVCGNERRTLKKHRPLQAGIAISTDSDSYGTLGWFGTLDADGTPVLLTNKHVLYGSAMTSDSRTLKTAQPQIGEVSKCCCCECGSDDVIGETIFGIKDIVPASDTSVDCGIAKINPEFASDIKLLITNNSTEEVLKVTGTAEAVVGDNVRKIGARSAFTQGVVVHLGDLAVEEATDPDGNDISIRQGQVLIIPADSETYEIKEGTCKKAFSNSGDSGAVILNENGEIIALNRAGDRKTHSIAITIANHIDNVLTKLSDNGFPITLAVSPENGGDSNFIKKERFTSPIKEGTNILVELRDANSNSHLRILYEKYHREVLQLINTNRNVGVIWQRNQGPAFVAAIARSANNPDYKIPITIQGITRKTLLNKISQGLIYHGSSSLKGAIKTYNKQIINSFAQGYTLLDIAKALKKAHLLDSVSPLLIEN